MTIAIKSTYEEFIFLYDLYKNRKKYFSLLKEKSKKALHLLKADKKISAFFDTMYILLSLDQITDEYFRLKEKQRHKIFKNEFDEKFQKLGGWGRSVDRHYKSGKKKEEHAGRTITVYGVEGLLVYTSNYKSVQNKEQKYLNFSEELRKISDELDFKINNCIEKIINKNIFRYKTGGHQNAKK